MPIASLERELGLRLFDRSKRQVRLTAAGAAYIAEVGAIFAQVKRADAVARQTDAGVRGHLAIGFTDALREPFRFLSLLQTDRRIGARSTERRPGRFNLLNMRSLGCDVWAVL